MSDISTTVTQADKDAARTLIRSLLQETDPNLDLSQGGLIDSIIVEGNVTTTAANTVQTNQAYLYQQLQAIADGTVTIEDEQLDELMLNYHITRNQATQASGTVEFIVRDSRQYIIQVGYTLRYNGLAFTVPATYMVYPEGTPGVDTTVETNIFLIPYYDLETGYLYRFRVPVQAVATGVDSQLVAGVRLTPDQTFTGFGYAQTVTNFLGGSDLETNAEFATRGLYGITIATLSGGQDQISKLVAQAYPQAKSSGVGVESAIQTRGRDNPFGLNYGGKLDLYVKSGAVAQNTIFLDAVVVDFTTRTASVTLTGTNAYGVYRAILEAYFTTTPPAGITGALTVTSTVHNQITRTDYNPELPQDIDRSGSANTEIVVTFTDTRMSGMSYIVSMTSNGQVISDTYLLGLQYMPGVTEVADALYAPAVRPPGTDVVIKAAVPCLVTLNIVATRPANYNGPTEDLLATEVAASINQLDMRLPYLDDYTISNILKQRSPDLLMQSVTMNGTILGQDGTNLSVIQTGNKLYIPTDLTSKVSYENTFFATSADLVTVTLV